MAGIKVRPCGPNAALLDCDPHTVVAVADTLRATERFVDVVPSECAVLVTWQQSVRFDELIEFAHQAPDTVVTNRHQLVEIPVVYDGQDLAEIAKLTGLSTSEVIHVHSSATYTAVFAGFAPGFVYCTGLPESLRLPRRGTARDVVPRGSVAIADQYSAVYPLASPGGWNLLGTTHLEMFDVSRAQPWLIAPGDSVRYVAVTP